ncbi:MAG: hypothetical protein LBQ67_04955 [Treponema sp.]|jgi:hypothetical protein|nr:hypothetical protein [Treponema sp.]
MRGKTYRVYLTEEEKKRLEDIISREIHSARQIRRGCMLLLLNETGDKQDKPVRVPERVLNRKKREIPPVQAKVIRKIEAKIIALSCSEPPVGYNRWTLRLLEEKSKGRLGIELSYTAIWRVLKKTPLKPHLKTCWCIPPQAKRGVRGRHGGHS